MSSTVWNPEIKDTGEQGIPGFNIMHFIESERKSGHSREAGERQLRKQTGLLGDVPALDPVASFSTFGSSPKKFSTLPSQSSTKFTKETIS